MLVLKGKKKIIFFLTLFLLLTTYEFNKESTLPIFKIKEIEFVNSVYLEENIKEKVINYLNNKSLINVRFKKISLYLNKSQWVKNYKLNKHYPNKIIIIINEFKPIALFKKKEKLYLINGNFEITNKIINKSSNLKMIEISGKYKKEEIKKKFLEIKKFDIFDHIKSINMLNLNRLDIYLKNNTQVKLGDYDINFQMTALSQVLKKYKNLKTIDLRNKGRIVIK